MMSRTKDTASLVDRFPALRRLEAKGAARHIPFIQHCRLPSAGPHTWPWSWPIMVSTFRLVKFVM